MGKRWLVHHRDGTCAVKGNREFADEAWSVPTLCGFVVTLPGGISQGNPTCEECRSKLNAIKKRKVTRGE